eukprot:gene24119-10206_t
MKPVIYDLQGTQPCLAKLQDKGRDAEIYTRDRAGMSDNLLLMLFQQPNTVLLVHDP